MRNIIGHGSGTAAAVLILLAACSICAPAHAAGKYNRTPPSYSLITVEFLGGLSPLNSTVIMRIKDLRMKFASRMPEGPGAIDFRKAESPDPPATVFARDENGSVVIEWDAETCVACLYNVYRVGAGHNFIVLNTKPLKANSYIDSAAPESEAADYYVEAVDRHGRRSVLSRPAFWLSMGSGRYRLLKKKP